MSGVNGYDFSDIWRGILPVWTAAHAYIYEQFRCRSLWYGYYVIYNRNVFSVWYYGSDSGGTAGNGTFNRANDPLGDRNGWNKSGVDLSCISVSQGVRLFVHILSGIVDSYDRHAGDLFLFCEEKGSCVTVRICKMIYVRK